MLSFSEVRRKVLFLLAVLLWVLDRDTAKRHFSSPLTLNSWSLFSSFGWPKIHAAWNWTSCSYVYVSQVRRWFLFLILTFTDDNWIGHNIFPAWAWPTVSEFQSTQQSIVRWRACVLYLEFRMINAQRRQHGSFFLSFFFSATKRTEGKVFNPHICEFVEIIGNESIHLCGLHSLAIPTTSTVHIFWIRDHQGDAFAEAEKRKGIRFAQETREHSQQFNDPIHVSKFMCNVDYAGSRIAATISCVV